MDHFKGRTGWEATKSFQAKFKSFLTPSLRRPFKPTILTRIPFFESFAWSRVNTPLVAVTNMGWRVHTQVFLRVWGNTLRCPLTKGTAVNEWVHSFADFCLIPYPRPIPLTFQPQICKDGFISIVFDVSPECCLFDWVRAGKTTAIKKTSHLTLEMSMNEAFIWLSGHRFIDREILMARNISEFSHENNPARVTEENIICPKRRGYMVFDPHHSHEKHIM